MTLNFFNPNPVMMGGKAQGGNAQFSAPQPFLAPTGGWVSAQNLAAARPNTCIRLENWFPTTTGIKCRAGSGKYATTGDRAVESLMAYIGGVDEQLFAADALNVYDVTAPADPAVPPTPVISGQTSGYYSFLNFATVGGNFMTIVNGTDFLQLYDGTTWTTINAASIPAITGVDTSTLSHVWAYKNRQWFIEGGTMNVWALPVDSIGGAAIQISLAGVFQHGGYLLTGATWSMDAGDGLDDKIVFISNKGEVAIYQGSNPADPADFSIVGRYDIPTPLGKRCTMNIGGDLIIGTVGGAVPISAAVTKDPAALSISAVSRNIEPDWVADANARSSLPWEFVKHEDQKLAYVFMPVTSDESVTPPQCYVVNLETNAWAKNTGWNTRCGVKHKDSVFFGTNSGTVMQVDIGGTDDGNLIYHTYIGCWDHMGIVSAFKEMKVIRAKFLAASPFIPKLSASVDFTISLPTAPNAGVPVGSPGLWDVGLYDQALWDAGLTVMTVSTKWVSYSISGTVFAPQIQITSGSTLPTDAELVIFEIVTETGNVVV